MPWRYPRNDNPVPQTQPQHLGGHPHGVVAASGGTAGAGAGAARASTSLARACAPAPTGIAAAGCTLAAPSGVGGPAAPCHIASASGAASWLGVSDRPAGSRHSWVGRRMDAAGRKATAVMGRLFGIENLLESTLVN